MADASQPRASLASARGATDAPLAVAAPAKLAAAHEATQARTGVFGRAVAFYSRAMTQVGLVGMVCFLCPGMFNALSGIGGGGQVDTTVSSKSNTALYACFAGLSFFAGSIHNLLGTRLCLFLGACGYSLYIASFLSYNHNANEGFVVAAGAILGVCASLFWTAQGAIMLSYPTEDQKSAAFAVVWVIFNLGALIGSAIEIGLTYHSDSDTLGDAVYAVFLVLTFLGACLSLMLKAPKSVVRSNGSNVIVPLQSSWQREFKGLYQLLIADPWILLLFPLFLSSNFAYTWQQQMYNAQLFTLRARSLNSLLYWGAQMVAAYLLSLVLDSPKMRRPKRMWVGWGIVNVFVWVVFGACYHVQLGYNRDNVANSKSPFPVEKLELIDLNTMRFAGPATLYFFSGFMDALVQGFAYALMGAFSNKMAVLASLSGFYKSIQSAGGAAGFGIDTDRRPFMATLAGTWAVYAAGLIFAVPVLAFRITDHTTDEEEERAAIAAQTGSGATGSDQDKRSLHDEKSETA